MDGTNGGSTFTDSSFFSRSISLTGSPTTETGTKKIGTAAAQFGAPTALTNIKLGNVGQIAGPFTLEFWYNFQSSASDSDLFTSNNLGASGHNKSLNIYTNSKSVVFVYENGTVSEPGGGSVNDSLWHHICIQRDATGTVTTFQDGASVSSVSDWNGLQIDFSDARIGGAVNQATICRGYIDEFRLSNVARYSTGGFTPSSSAFVAD